jgi:hypothetical protein
VIIGEDRAVPWCTFLGLATWCLAAACCSVYKLLSLDLYQSHVGMDSTASRTLIEIYAWRNGSRERMALRWVGIACE